MTTVNVSLFESGLDARIETLRRVSEALGGLQSSRLSSVDFLQSLVLGVVEGLTEFLPISSTGHLTIVENLYGLKIDSKAVTAFTAVIQMGAIVAVIVYFRQDIVRIVSAWFRGIVKPEVRGSFDYRMGWYVIVGTIPVAIVGLAGQSVITGALRNLWWVASALIVWSAVMILAERMATQRRHAARSHAPRRADHRRPCSASP